MKKDIVERLREASGYALMDNARVTVLEAAEEIERLRSLTRFQDGVIRSGDTACLTEAERGAIADAADRYASVTPESAETAATLRGLLERMK